MNTTSNGSSFAINYEIKYHTKQDDGSQRFYGSLVLCLNSSVIGDPEIVVSLDSCRYWLEDLICNRIYRDTKRYSYLSLHELIHVFRSKSIFDLEEFGYDVGKAIIHVKNMPKADFCEGMDLYSLTYISHVGQNSLDNTILLMIDDKPKFKRFIVQRGKNDPEEYIIKIEDIITGTKNFLTSFDDTINKLD